MTTASTDRRLGLEEQQDLLLFFPPQCETALQGPHLALPLLSGYLRSEGFRVEYRDLNIRFFHHLAAADALARERTILEHRRRHLQSQPSLAPDELQELLVLSGLLVPGGDLAHGTTRSSLRRMEDFRRVQYLVQQQLHRLPRTWSEILDCVLNGRSTALTEFYETFDLDAILDLTRVVGLTVAFHLQLYPALELARLVKARRGRDVRVMLGGSQISLLKDGQLRALAALPIVDAVTVYEGERPLRDVCRQLRARGDVDFSQIPNTYGRREGGITEARFDVPIDIGALPTPAFAEADLPDYLRPVSFPVYVSKGCYWGRCKFCDYTKLYTPGQAKSLSWARFRPVPRVVADIERLMEAHGAESFLLISEAISPKFYREFAGAMVARDLGARFWSYCRVEKGQDFAFFRHLHRAGVRALTFGVEATEDRILKLIDKGNTVADVENSIRCAHAAGIAVHFNVIPDYPTITWPEVERTVEFIRHNIDFIDQLSYQFFDLSANAIILDELADHGLTVDGASLAQQNHGMHCLDFARTAGLTEPQAAEVRRLFATLSSRIDVYRRSRDLVARMQCAGFDWREARFVVGDDFWMSPLPFDPSRPVRGQDGSVHFIKLAEPVLVLGSPTTRHHLTSSPAVRLILDAARARGILTVDDVLATLPGTVAPDDVAACRPAIERCLEALVHEGFVTSLFHPWMGMADDAAIEPLAEVSP
jgi:hypothetical protein